MSSLVKVKIETGDWKRIGLEKVELGDVGWSRMGYEKLWFIKKVLCEGHFRFLVSIESLS